MKFQIEAGQEIPGLSCAECVLKLLVKDWMVGEDSFELTLQCLSGHIVEIEWIGTGSSLDVTTSSRKGRIA